MGTLCWNREGTTNLGALSVPSCRLSVCSSVLCSVGLLNMDLRGMVPPPSLHGS
jgi:hypothetical protein